MEMNLNSKAVHVGDTVKFEFLHREHASDSNFLPTIRGVVLEIQRRFGKRHPKGDLITYRDLATGDIGNADAGFITEIVAIGKGPRYKYRVKTQLESHQIKDYVNICATKKRGEWFGDFKSMFSYVLAMNPNFVVDTYADYDKAFKLWKKTQVGMKQVPAEYRGRFFQGCYLVSVKPFKRWVKQNFNRFLMTAEACHFNGDMDEDENIRMWQEDEEHSWKPAHPLDAILEEGGIPDPQLDAAMHLNSEVVGGFGDEEPVTIEDFSNFNDYMSNPTIVNLDIDPT